MEDEDEDEGGGYDEDGASFEGKGGGPGDAAAAQSLCLDGFTDFLTDPQVNGIFDPLQTQANQPRTELALQTH